MRLRRRPKRPLPDNTVPLINIVFLMLIFFLFAGTVTRDDAARIETPESVTEDERIRSTGALVIDADGKLFHGSDETGIEDRVAAFQQTDALEGPLLIAPDARLPAAALKDVLTKLNAAGAKDIVLITRRKAQ